MLLTLSLILLHIFFNNFFVKYLILLNSLKSIEILTIQHSANRYNQHSADKYDTLKLNIELIYVCSEIIYYPSIIAGKLKKYSKINMIFYRFYLWKILLIFRKV